MAIIDSMSFKVRSKKPDENEYYPLVKIKNTIENLSGDLLIDNPNNKAGVKQFTIYPIFNCINNAYVYYDNYSVLEGAYTRDKFYYRMDPFSIDSLDNFNPDALEFYGYLTSAGIFPDIDKSLVVMDDYFLGLKKTTTSEGLPIYAQKATFTNKITLNGGGLQGEGMLRYLNSKTEANNFIFFPDSSTCITDNYKINETTTGVMYPNVEASEVAQTYLPYKDEMHIKQIDEVIKMYRDEDESFFKGSLVHSPSGLIGSGTMNIKYPVIKSRRFDFKNRTFDCDTADFKLMSFDKSQLAFSTEDYNVHIDYENHKGIFKSNGGTSLVKFHFNQYICYMDKFEWDMNKNEIELVNDQNKLPAGIDNMSLEEIAYLDISGSEFVSVHPEQDSLRFFSAKAKYNNKEQIIYATGVRIIKVADAAIFPSDKNITILKNAQMLPLENAQILANTTTKYHIFNNAWVKILGRLNYVANAYYEYVDENENFQFIYFDKIAVDTTLQTYANGYIADSIDFSLSPHFDFTGNVNLIANRKFLNFSGIAGINNDCYNDTTKQICIKFDTIINPQEIYIPIGDKIKANNLEKVYAGIFMSADSIQTYSAFLKPIHKYNDVNIISSKGLLIYEPVSNEYRISSYEKLNQLSLPDNLLSLNLDKCRTRGEGKLNLGTDLGQVEINVYGRAEHYIVADSTNLQMTMSLDFFFNEDCINIMKEKILSYGELEALSLTAEIYTKSLKQLLGVEEANKIIAELNTYGKLSKIPKKLIHTINIADINMKWNSKTKSYVSVGQIGIGSIGETQINRYLNGFVEIQCKRSGDKLTIYLEPSSSDTYYFSYSRGLMLAYSSNDEFNKFITETNSDKRQLNVDNKETAYSYYLATKRTVDSFLKKMKGE